MDAWAFLEEADQVSHVAALNLRAIGLWSLQSVYELLLAVENVC